MLIPPFSVSLDQARSALQFLRGAFDVVLAIDKHFAV